MGNEIEKAHSWSLMKLLARCEFVPTHMEGTHIAKTKGVLNGREYRVTSDVVLCRFCGNFEGSDNNKDFCPALMRFMLNE